MKSAILRVIIFLVGLIPMLALGRELELTPEQAANVALETTEVIQRKVSFRLSLTGRLVKNQRRSFHVAPIVEGVVEAVEAVAHDEVTKGQVLARLRSDTLGQAQADYLDALAQFDLAQTERRRIEGLWREGIVAENRWLQADSDNKRATAALDQKRRLLALVGLSETQIRALKNHPDRLAQFELVSPSDGVVLDSEVEIGQVLSAGETAFHIIDLSSLWAEVHIPVANLSNVTVGAIAQIRVQARPEQAIQGRLVSLGGEVEERSQTVVGRIVVNNPDRLLRPGMYAQVELTGITYEGPAVPSSAVFRLGDKTYVFKALGSRRFEPVAVSIGAEADGWVPVTGLKEGVEIVIDGVVELKGHWQYQGSK